ncbi:sigma-70 family RNA polymerase sigma factor [bacterium]|nr:sigma-70 family RNA polymerase sigma factor [bacterium]
MDEQNWLAEKFEAHRPHLRAVAYRMLGSAGEADDAIQEAWLRLSRSDASEVENLKGWLTTVVARLCLDWLRSRKTRRETPLENAMPDPIVTRVETAPAQDELLMSEAVGLAMLVVLETLGPAERLAFVLHDMFSVPFEDIAPMVQRTPAAARQLASRARRRVQGEAAAPEGDPERQREAVVAFLAAARGGDFGALLRVLDPDVVLRTDRGAQPGSFQVFKGAKAISEQAVVNSRAGGAVRAVQVNGLPGIVSYDREGRVSGVLGFVVRGGTIVEINVFTDPERLARLDLPALSDD